jgi:hypothetical protein
MVISIFSLTRSTAISNEGISVRSLLGERSIRWSEIDSVSGRGNRIKLHNRDGDVTVAPSPQLPGYAEVIEMIGTERLDLFTPARYSVMSRNWLGSLWFLVASLIFIGIGVFLYFDAAPNEIMMSVIFLAVMGLAFIATIFMSVLSLRLDGSSLTIRYLLGQTVLKRDEVKTVGLDVRQTRNGKTYHIFIFTDRGRTIRFSGLGPSLPIVYLVLKNWHQSRAS